MTDRRDEAIELAEALTAAVDGRYIIGGIVGHGRYGLTVRARDVSGRIVALKVAWKDEESRTQVLRETELTAKIEHPNILIPRRVDVPEPLLVVETTLMAGSLGDSLDAKKPLPFDKVREMLLAVGPALDKAHSLGIVHGGILPEKIFVDDNGRYFIGDFSLRLPQAVFVEGNRPSAVGFTAYTPMEQRHDLPSADGRIDEFSLAVVAYELLRGHRRWRFGDEGVLEIDAIDMVVSRPIAPGAPPVASAAIRRATSREAAYRYASVGDFVRSFAGLSHSATPAEHIYRVTPIIEKHHRWVWLLPIAAGIAALVAFRPMVRDSAIKLWHADWTSGAFWRGDFSVIKKSDTETGTGSASTTTTQGAATQRSNGTASGQQTTRGGDGKTTVGVGTANPGPAIDPYPRVRPQGGTQAAPPPARVDAGADRSRPSGKSTPIASGGEAIRDLVDTSSKGSATKKAAETGTGSISVSINGAGEAEVYIDGRSRGRAPLTWEGSTGRHIVTLRPTSPYTPALIEVNVTRGSTVQAVFTTR